MKKLSLILAITLILASFGNVLTGVAFADTLSIYTDVLEDLRKDETFDVAQFPKSDKDKMDVFQVAESNAGEVFLYVYAPQGDKLTASEVRISTSIGDNLAPKDYKLTLLSRNGTLSKYIVNDLAVKSDVVRYYLIIQIARPWDKNLDGELPGDNTGNTKAYATEKLFTACTIDGNVTYTETHADVITIIDKYVGYLRYLNGFWIMKSSCDSHFVAFDTDKPIDRLIEATVSFVHKHCTEIVLVSKTYGDSKTEEVTLYDDDNVSNDASIFGVKHTWSRIEKVSDFINKEDLEKDVEDELRNKQWVLRFYESNVTEAYGRLYKSIDSEVVTDVTILRLKFETNGDIYNLGVVDNKQTGNTEPAGGDDLLDEANKAIKRVIDFFNMLADFFQKFVAFFKQYWWVFLIIAVLIALAILAKFCKPVAEFLVLPFKLIGKLFKKGGKSGK